MANVRYVAPSDFFVADADPVSRMAPWSSVVELAPGTYATNNASGQRIVLTGDLLVYSNGMFTGNVTGITLSERFVARFSGISGTSYVQVPISEAWGFSIPAAALVGAINSGDRGALADLLYGEGVTFFGTNYASGSAFGPQGDIFRGADGADIFLGLAGNDQLVGEGGDDRFWGGDGADALIGGDGADLIFGEGGNDTAWGGAGNDIALMGSGDDYGYGDAGDDLIFGEAGADVLLGGGGADFLALGDGNDFAWGEAGADYVMGEAGADFLSGGDGNDVLVGGAGDDVLMGDGGADALFFGAGNDYALGGSGGDYFYATADGAEAGVLDFIGDFDAASTGTADWLVLSAAYQSSTQTFDSAGYAWVAISTGGGTHYIAVSGALAADVQAQIIWN